LAARGQLSLDQEVPDLLQAPIAGEIQRRILAVVVEAFASPDVANLRIGDADPLQARGYLDVQITL